ncbi:hypothetical protein Naga_100540g3 [Nannochloropsis gaditana]|uniref:Uncharacterized protein n=1 Tax=Nannochloropsis gaditana TaxID=72520 RepID=W7TN88_9STRA|nr:hypothetical protein Naga_100540g3 [Nannochloropsis gaditana]
MAAMTTIQPLMLFHVCFQGGKTCRNASRSSNVTSDSINRDAEDELHEILDYSTDTNQDIYGAGNNSRETVSLLESSHICCRVNKASKESCEGGLQVTVPCIM